MTSIHPYVYLIPVGKDFMRTPPLGDSNNLRSWNVADVSVPLPFNIGASEFSSKRYWQSSDSLSEDLFAVRKHQAFRAVATVDSFQQMTHSMDNYTNNRLIGRSVWNTKWKLVIPGRSLLNDPDEGINRFVNSVPTLNCISKHTPIRELDLRGEKYENLIYSMVVLLSGVQSLWPFLQLHITRFRAWCATKWATRLPRTGLL